MEYILKFIGHIDELKRPMGFSHEIVDIVHVRFENTEQLVTFVNERCIQYSKNQGMAVKIDPQMIEQIDNLETGRMFVPMHMITYLTVAVHTVAGETPIMISDGKYMTADGNEVKIN